MVRVPGGVWVRTLASRLSRISRSHRPALERASLVETGEEKEILDERLHPRRLDAHTPQHPRQVSRPLLRAPFEQLRVRAHRADRRAQLVRRVGDEAPETFLRRLLLGEGVLDALQHRVQRHAEPADLGAIVGLLDAQAQLAAGDVRRRALDVAQGPQPDSHQPEAEPDRDEEHSGGHEDLGQQQPLQRRVHVVERQRDHQQRVVRQPLSADAELAVLAAGGVDREEGCAFIVVRVEPRHLFGEARPRRRELAPGRLAHEGRAVPGAELDVRAGRRCRQRTRVTAGTAIQRAEERADERRVRGGEALVDAVDEERPQRGVRGDVGGDQSDESDGGDCDEEAGP